MTVAQTPLPERLRAIVGSDGLLGDPADRAPFLVDHLGRCRGNAIAVVQPRSAAQVSQLLALCEAERIGVVPHGGNTSYCGGAIPDESGRQLVLSLRRLNRIRSNTQSLSWKNRIAYFYDKFKTRTIRFRNCARRPEFFGPLSR